MGRRAPIVIIAVACIAVAASTIARAEVVGPLLPKGSFEIGVQERYLERELDAVDYPSTTLDRRDAALTARWAFTELATVSVEGITGTGEFVTSEEDVEEYWVIGSGLQALIWHNRRVTLAASMHFTEMYLRRTDPERPDQTSTSWGFELLAQSDFAVAGQVVTAFAGPAYSWEELILLEGVGRPFRILLEATSTWGGIVGAVVLLGDHVTLNGHVLWVDNPQPRFGIGYRF